MDIILMFLRVSSFLEWEIIMHLSVGLALPYFLSYADFQSAEKVTSPQTCFTTNMLQNEELLSLKQWHLKIGYTDRTVSFNASKQFILLL